MFEGEFKGKTPSSEEVRKERQQSETIDLNWPDTSPPVFLYIYPAKAASAKWQTIKAGSTVRFRAKIGGVVVTEVRGAAYIVSLCDAEPQ